MEQDLSSYLGSRPGHSMDIFVQTNDRLAFKNSILEKNMYIMFRLFKKII